MPTGKLKFVNSDKGFGFIVRDDGEADAFFHITQCVDRSDFDSLQIGTRIEFEMGKSANGRPAAINVQIARDEVRQPGPVRYGMR